MLDTPLDPPLRGRNVEVGNLTDAHERQAVGLPRPPHDRSGVLVEPRSYLLDGLKLVESLGGHGVNLSRLTPYQSDISPRVTPGKSPT
jgi:hypothetical protein